MRVGPSTPTEPTCSPSTTTGATTTEQTDSGSTPCSTPIATDMPRSTRSRTQRDDDELLLERVQHLPHDVDRVECLGHRRGATDVHVVVGEPGADGGDRGRAQGVDRRVVGRRERPDDRPAWRPTDVAARWAEAALEDGVAGASSSISMISFSTVPLPSTSTTVAAVDDRRTSWALRMVAASDFGPTTTAALCVSLVSRSDVWYSISSSRPWAAAKKSPICGVTAASSVLGRGEMVDEEAVALVGRDAPRRGVGLDQEALLLEHRHLVANRCRRHADARGRGDVRGADRLRGRDVLLHHGAQDCGLAIVEHLAVKTTEC